MVMNNTGPRPTARLRCMSVLNSHIYFGIIYRYQIQASANWQKSVNIRGNSQ